MHLVKSARQRFTILETMNSILYPGRFTLLLGPPGAGKSTLLNALAGRLHKSSTMDTTGSITYNGKGFDQFRAVHTSAYVDQNDLHQPELTVRETFNFAARCQGTGHKAGIVQYPALKKQGCCSCCCFSGQHGQFCSVYQTFAAMIRSLNCGQQAESTCAHCCLKSCQ